LAQFLAWVMLGLLVASTVYVLYLGLIKPLIIDPMRNRQITNQNLGRE